jgi:outer membrane protein TolC
MSRTLSYLLGGLLAGFPPFVAPAVAGQELGPVPVKLTLQEAVRMALDRAPEVRLADAQAIRTREAVREARALNLPQVALGTGLAYNNGFPLSLEGAAPSIFQIGVSQSILSRKNTRLILEAEENSRASQMGVEVARDDLASTAALAYSELHEARKTEAIWSSRMDSFLREEQIRETEYQAGRARRLDVVLAGTATSEARHQLLVAREQARVAEAQLKELSGIQAASPIATAEPQLAGEALNMPPDALLRMALETNPEIRQAEALVQAREHHVGAEKGEKYPRLDIIGQYAVFSKFNHYQDYFSTFNRNNFLLGLSVEVPIFNGSRTSARVAQSQQELAEARFRLQHLKSELRMSLERSASALRIAQGAAELASKEVAAAHESLQVQDSLFEGGRTAPKDLEAARNLVREKELGQIEAEKILFQRQVELLRLSGTLASLVRPN